MPSSINEDAPVNIRRPARNQARMDRGGDERRSITTEGEEKIPEPIWRPRTRERPLRAVRVRGGDWGMVWVKVGLAGVKGVVGWSWGRSRLADSSRELILMIARRRDGVTL